MEKFKLWLKRIWIYVLLAVGTVLTYLVFIKKLPAKLGPRPTKFPGSDKPSDLPLAPPKIDWHKKVEKDLVKVKKEHAKLNRKQLLDDINKRYNSRKRK